MRTYNKNRLIDNIISFTTYGLILFFAIRVIQTQHESNWVYFWIGCLYGGIILSLIKSLLKK